jgi:hypothetical protein
MKKIFLFGILFCSAWFWGCYNDKGHYDYLPENTVVISFPYIPPAVVGDTLRFSPRLTFRNPDDTTGFEYWWERVDNGTLANPNTAHHEIICEGRELVYLPKKGQQILQFCAKELRSGVTFYSTITINGSSLYRKGWLILTENEGVSGLSFILADRAIPGNTSSERKYVPYLDFWKNLFPDEELGRNPVALGQAYSGSDPITCLVYVLQGNNGSVCLDGFFFQKELLLSKEFLGGAPDNLNPVAYIQGGNSSMLMNGDGTVYHRVTENGGFDNFFTDQFPNFPVQHEREVLTIDRIIPGFLSEQPLYMLYDRTNHRFLWIDSNVGILRSSHIESLPTGSLDYNHTGDAFIHYSALYNEGSYLVSNITLYEQQGEIYVQRCEARAAYSPPYTVTINGIQKNLFPEKNLVTSTTRYWQLKTRPYLFFATGNRLYWYDHLTGTVHLYYTLDAGDEVVKMGSNPQESELTVLSKSGKFIALDILNEHLMGTANKIYEVQIPGEKMVDMLYRYADYFSFRFPRYFAID